MPLSITLSALHLGIALWLIGKYKLLSLRGISRKASQLLFTVKVLLVYFLFRYYSSHPDPVDTTSFLRDSALLFDMFSTHPLATLKYMLGNGPLPDGFVNAKFDAWTATVFLPFFNDNHTVIVINLLLRFLSFGAAGVHLVWMSFIGWMGICQLGKIVLPETKAAPMQLFPFLLPQVLIWPSLVLKEPLMIFSLGFLMAGLSEWSKKDARAWRHLLIGTMGFIFVKTFLLFLLLPATCAFLLAHTFRKVKPVWFFVLLPVLLLSVLILVSGYAEAFHIPALLYGQQLSMYRFVVYSHAGSILQPVSFAPVWTSFLKHIPEAVSYALLQPFPWIYTINLGWLVFIENLAVLIFFLYSLLRNRHVILFSPKRMMFLCSGLMILVVAGFVTPVAGTLIRYKMPGVFLLCLGVLPARHHFHHHKHLHHDRQHEDTNPQKNV